MIRMSHWVNAIWPGSKVGETCSRHQIRCEVPDGPTTSTEGVPSFLVLTQSGKGAADETALNAA